MLQAKIDKAVQDPNKYNHVIISVVEFSKYGKHLYDNL